MALTPEGTPYVESSDLVANYPAASLSLANRVDLVGVLPFATSAARATAIPSPTDGQYSYLQDTNLTQFWNGSAWQTAGLTPGLNLVTPTSIANSGGSASASGGAVTFTTVNSISLNGVFSSAYENYRLIFNGTTSAASVGLLMRYRASGTDATASVYSFGESFTSATTAGFSTGSASATNGRLTNIYVGFKCGVAADIYSPNANIEKALAYFSPSGDAAFYGFTRCTSTTQFDGLTIYPASGNITGNIRVYGYQNS